jgi:SAM-dependent methyltransferase
MAHFQQTAFVEQVRVHLPAFFERTKVLEVGSWNVTGTIRGFFQSCDYLGVDIAAGPCVDLVCPGEKLTLAASFFDFVISCECFEHNPFWLETFLNMTRMLRPGGLFVFTCATTGRGEHGTVRTGAQGSLTALQLGSNYYRNLSRRDFERGADLCIHFDQYRFVTNPYSKDLYFVGIKRGTTDTTVTEKLDAVARAAAQITQPRPPTAVRTISAYAEWRLKCATVRVLGEQRYHDVRHRVRPRKAPPSQPRRQA